MSQGIEAPALTGERISSRAYVVPFAVLLASMAVIPYLRLHLLTELVVRALVPTLALLLFSWRVLDFRCTMPGRSLLAGVAVFVIWVAPDLLWPGYREHWLFVNRLTGELSSSMPESFRQHGTALLLRSFRAILVVPVIEELFWRGWMTRWIDRNQFSETPLGVMSRSSFLLTAALFGAEHGPYWDVGFAAGAFYNWWLVRTRRLGDLFLAHAATNACLSLFVVYSGRWEFWL